MKYESVELPNAPSIPRSYTDSKQCRGLDLSELNADKEKMRKKHKYLPQVEKVDAAAMNSLPNIGPRAREEPSLLPGAFQTELERIFKETEELQKCHEDMMLGMKSECAKEIEKLVVEIQKKYQLKCKHAQEQYKLKINGVNLNHKKRMNKLLADAYSINCFNLWSAWSQLQQGFPSNTMQYPQNLVKPAGATAPNLQSASHTGQPAQPVAAMSRPQAINGVHHTSIPRSAAPHFKTSIPPTSSSTPTVTQNLDIRPNYASGPSQNMPQTQNFPINPMSAPRAPFGYHPQGCNYPNLQGPHQLPLKPSYPYANFPHGYPPSDSSKRNGIDGADTKKDGRMPSSETVSHSSPQGLENISPAVDSDSNDEGNSNKLMKVLFSEVESEILAQCWVDMSIASVAGIVTDIMWMRICSIYNKLRPANTEERTWTSLKTHFNELQKKTKWFSDYYYKNAKIQGNSKGDADIIEMAQLEYQQHHGACGFKHIGVWRIITKCPKFTGEEISDFSSNSDSSASNDAETGTVQPIGQKEVKQNAEEDRKPGEFVVMENGIKEENADITR